MRELSTQDDARAYERRVPSALRAEHGMFYTPDALADRVAWAALAEWLGARGLGFEEAWALVAHGKTPDAARARRAARALSSPRVLDPSCGGGALLAAAHRALARAAKALGARVDARLVGTDRDPAAVALARARLPDDARVEIGDALALAAPAADLVLTNPPYGAADDARDVDRYVTFWRAAAAQVRRGGVLAVLAPTSWRTGVRYAEARRTVIEPAGLTRVLLVPRGAFPDAYVDTCIAVCRVGSPKAPALTVLEGGFGASPPAPSRAEPSRAMPAPSCLGDHFTIARGILLPARPGSGERLLVGPIAPFAWPRGASAFTSFDPRRVREGIASLRMSAMPRLLVRRIVGRSERLSCLVAGGRAAVKKDFYVLAPRSGSSPFPRLSLPAYAALLHARPIAAIVAAREVASTKNDFAQVSLSVLRALGIPALATPSPAARTRAAGARFDVRRLDLTSAWLEARAIEGAAIGRALLEGRTRHIDADPRWTDLRARLDAFAERFVAAFEP